MTEAKHAKTLKYPTVKGPDNPEMVLRSLFNRIVLECGITGARWSRLLDAFVRKQEMLRGRKVVNIVEAKATANKTFGTIAVVELCNGIGGGDLRSLLRRTYVHPHDRGTQGRTILIEREHRGRRGIVGDADDRGGRDPGIVDGLVARRLEATQPFIRILLSPAWTRVSRLVRRSSKRNGGTFGVEDSGANALRTKVDSHQVAVRRSCSVRH